MNGLVASLAFLGIALQAQEAVPEAPVLTMEEAVDIALDSAFAIRIQASEAERLDYSANAAWGQLGPQFSLSASYLRDLDGDGISDAGGTSGGATGGFGGGQGGGQASGFAAGSRQTQQPSQPAAPTINDFKTVTLQFQQVLDVLGQYRAGARAARLQAEAAEANLQAERNTVVNNVRTAYLNVVAARELADVQAERVEASEERLENARAQFEQGVIPLFNVLQLESQLASNVQALIESENNFDLSKQNLNNVLARPIETPFEVMEIGELPDVLLVPEEVTALAVRNRPEVQAAELTIDALENVVESEEGGSLPTFSLGASYQYTIDAPMGVDDTSALGTLSISWPVFDSGITRNRVNAAEEQVNQAEIRLEQLQLGISLDVNNALTQISNASATLEVAQQNLETATEALRLAELRFDAGEGILLDVLDAQAQVTGAQANLVAARTQYLIAFANLQRAVGMDEFNEQPQEEDADEANRE